MIFEKIFERSLSLRKGFQGDPLKFVILKDLWQTFDDFYRGERGRAVRALDL